MPKSKTRKKKKTQHHGPAKPPSKRKPPSPKWYVITMFGLMGLGTLAVVFNYVFPSFGGWGLWVGLVAIGAGFMMTTNYR